jgi:hypothetical protein
MFITDPGQIEVFKYSKHDETLRESDDDYDPHTDPSVMRPHDLPLSNGFSQKYSLFLECISREMACATAIPFENAGKFVDRAFLRYMSYHLSHHLARRKERKGVGRISRLIKALRIGSAAGTSAVLDRRFDEMLSSPYEFALTSYVLRKRSLPLDVFVKRFSCYRDFEPIHDFL